MKRGSIFPSLGCRNVLADNHCLIWNFQLAQLGSQRLEPHCVYRGFWLLRLHCISFGYTYLFYVIFLEPDYWSKNPAYLRIFSLVTYLQ